MKNNQLKHSLLKKMKDCLIQDDRVTIHEMNRLGILTITRKHNGITLQDRLMTSCPHCKTAHSIYSSHYYICMIFDAIKYRFQKGYPGNHYKLITIDWLAQKLIAESETIKQLERYFNQSIEIEVVEQCRKSQKFDLFLMND